MTNLLEHSFRIKSYVRRGRQTASQARAFNELWGKFGLSIEDGLLNFSKTFGRLSSCILEIGFGSGESLTSLAKDNPDKNFIGVETHKPGIGAVFRELEKEKLANVRVYHADIVDVLEKCIPPKSLDLVLIFFPDPWEKRKHTQRRLVQIPFIKTIAEKLKTAGRIELASDCEEYAKLMLHVLSQNVSFKNLAESKHFSAKSMHRSAVTKFEKRALSAGHKIFELQFQKI